MAALAAQSSTRARRGDPERGGALRRSACRAPHSAGCGAAPFRSQVPGGSVNRASSGPVPGISGPDALRHELRRRRLDSSARVRRLQRGPICFRRGMWMGGGGREEEQRGSSSGAGHRFGARQPCRAGYARAAAPAAPCRILGGWLRRKRFRVVRWMRGCAWAREGTRARPPGGCAAELGDVRLVRRGRLRRGGRRRRSARAGLSARRRSPRGPWGSRPRGAAAAACGWPGDVPDPHTHVQRAGVLRALARRRRAGFHPPSPKPKRGAARPPVAATHERIPACRHPESLRMYSTARGSGSACFRPPARATRAVGLAGA
jgi:hypothetical protein